jgi:Zn-dependent peptidase ImmA (M78 family)
VKPRRRDAEACQAARALLDAAGIREPEDLDLDALAVACGAYILEGALPNEDGHRLRAGRASVIRVRAGANPERTQFTKAHEIGHGVLHGHINQLARCTGEGGGRGARRGGDREDFRRENGADDFSVELIYREDDIRRWLERLEATGDITLDRVSALAKWRRASLQSAAIRVAELARGEVAFVHVTHGVIDWAAESHPYDGRIIKKRPVQAGTLAARLATTAPVGKVLRDGVPGRHWGTVGEVVEEALRTDYGSVISWIWRPGSSARF